MDRDYFSASQRRHVVRAERGYLAFVPPPLPPDLVLDAALVRQLSEADRALGELAGAGRSLPNQAVLAGNLVRREAVLSSQIEGTQASLSDLVLFEAGNGPESVRKVHGPGDDDVREIVNYIAAVRHVLAPDRRLPVSIPLLREAHAILMSGSRGGHATPGEVRRSQNWIGPPGATLDGATYIPPPPERLWECLGTFEKHLHASRDLPPLVTIGCAHYQFEAIHPFLDGNGRIGRLLIVLLLVEWGLLDAPILDLSARIEPRCNEYYARLLATSTDGDWSGWLSFFSRRRRGAGPRRDRSSAPATQPARRLPATRHHGEILGPARGARGLAIRRAGDHGGKGSGSVGSYAPLGEP